MGNSYHNKIAETLHFPGQEIANSFSTTGIWRIIHNIYSKSHRTPGHPSCNFDKMALNNSVQTQSRKAFIGVAFALAFLGPPVEGSTASFDCSKASLPVEKMICSDVTLSQLDDLLGDAYRIAKDHAASEIGLKRKQNRWIAIRNACHDRECIHRAYELRIKELNTFASSQERGTTHRKDEIQKDQASGGRPAEAQPKKAANKSGTPSVCATMLNPNVIRWTGAGEVGDHFTVNFPADVKPIDWKYFHSSGAVPISEAVMDFTGKGKKETIFRIEVHTSHAQSTSYVLAEKDEADDYREKFSSIEEGAQWDTQLQTVIESFGQSRLYDSSTTDAYQWYTSSELFTFQGRTYMVALSVNNLSGPTAAIFKPKGGGELELICRYDVKKSKRTWTKTFQSPTKTCPTNESLYPKIQNEVPLPWETISDKVSTVEVNIPSWGGSRRLFKITTIAGHYQDERIFTGPKGTDLKDAVLSNVYSGAYPFSGLDIDHIFESTRFDDSVGVMQDPSGIFIVTYNRREERGVDSPLRGTTYHVIEGGELVPICTFELIATLGK